MERDQTVHDLCLLQARADRRVRVDVTAQLEQHKLTYMEWLALGVIVGSQKPGTSMSQLARQLDVTLPQVTALVARLLELKLVKQKVLATDHRGRQATATLKGKRVTHKLETALRATRASWTKDVSQKNLDAYVQVVKRLAE